MVPKSASETAVVSETTMAKAAAETAVASAEATMSETATESAVMSESAAVSETAKPELRLAGRDAEGQHDGHNGEKSKKRRLHD